jgi:hypothetical protein
MMKLVNAEQVQAVPGKGWLPKVRVINSKQLYVNFELLEEYKMKMGLAPDSNNRNIRRIM